MVNKIVGYLLVALVIICFSFLNLASPDHDMTDSLALIAFLSSFSLWIWMITDFFRNKELKSKALWGWSLIIFNVIAAAVYFIIVYSRKKIISNP